MKKRECAVRISESLHITSRQFEIALTYLPMVRRVPEYRQDMIVSQVLS